MLTQGHCASSSWDADGSDSAPERRHCYAEGQVRFHGQFLDISDLQDEWLACLWPEVDRHSQYREIESWLDANPRRRPRNMKRFLHTWFSRQKRREIARPEDEAMLDGARVRLTSAVRRRNEWVNF
jgi:hypothetical protein